MTDPYSPINDFYPTDFEVDMNGKRFAWQGIAKLPFIDECRLLAEVEKVEHTLTEEEARRNSTMPDMLFIALSHKLSPYIYSLDSRCKQLSDKERIEIKEQIDPLASGGMNGYISLCVGDPCPTIFKSPVHGMEDIMDNQVICAVYRLPDYHEHIARPPEGVKLPEKTVTVDDLQPEPALWHEDSGRKPWESGRYEHNIHDNPHGSVSGQQLRDAAHRLVVNSLQVKPDRSNDYPQLYDPQPHGPYNHDPHIMVHPSSGYHTHHINRDHRSSNLGTRHYNYDANHGQPYNRLNPQMGQPLYSVGGGRYTHVYQPVVRHYGGLYVMQRPQGSFDGYQYLQQGGDYNYIPYNALNNYHHQNAGWSPRGNERAGRGYASQHGLSMGSRTSRAAYQSHRR